MASTTTSISPLNWTCSNCDARFSEDHQLTFYRGSCNHDVCNKCITVVGSLTPNSTSVKCPSSWCRRGRFANPTMIKTEIVAGASGDNVKNEEEGVDLPSYKEGIKASASGDDLDVKPAAIKSEVKTDIKMEQQTPTIKRETIPDLTTSMAATKRLIGEKKTKKFVSPSVPPVQILKPILNVGDEVYAAWWEDTKRRGVNAWYPGKVKSYIEVGNNNFGPIRLYDIIFDDGDKIDKLGDCFLFAKDEYLLRTKYRDQMPMGVKEVFDMSSMDVWAKIVGWYSVVIDGEDQHFVLLSDAMEAYAKQHAKIKQEIKEESTDDNDSRFSGGEDDSVAGPPEKKRRKEASLQMTPASLKSKKQKETPRQLIASEISYLHNILRGSESNFAEVKQSSFKTGDMMPLDVAQFNKNKGRYEVKEGSDVSDDDVIIQSMLIFALYRMEKGWGRKRAFQALSIWSGKPANDDADNIFTLTNLWKDEIQKAIAEKKLGKNTLGHPDNFDNYPRFYGNSKGRWGRRSSSYVGQVHMFAEQATVQIALYLHENVSEQYALLASMIVHFAFHDDDKLMYLIASRLIESARKESDCFPKTALDVIISSARMGKH